MVVRVLDQPLEEETIRSNHAHLLEKHEPTLDNLSGAQVGPNNHLVPPNPFIAPNIMGFHGKVSAISSSKSHGSEIQYKRPDTFDFILLALWPWSCYHDLLKSSFC